MPKKMILLKKMTNYNFLNDFYLKADLSYRDYLKDVDAFLISNYSNILIDIDKYNLYISFFINAHDEEFKRVTTAINSKYDPITNYKMQETENITKNHGKTEKTIAPQGEKIIERKIMGSQEIITENEQAVIENGNLKKTDKQTVTTNPLNNYGDITTEKFQNNYNQTETTENLKPETESRGLTRSGNIGVTTSQQMIESTFELEKKNKIVTYIADVFIEELTSGMYYYEEEEVEIL